LSAAFAAASSALALASSPSARMRASSATSYSLYLRAKYWADICARYTDSCSILYSSADILDLNDCFCYSRAEIQKNIAEALE
jgi:hypothetical protein